MDSLDRLSNLLCLHQIGKYVCENFFTSFAFVSANLFKHIYHEFKVILSDTLGARPKKQTISRFHKKKRELDFDMCFSTVFFF